MITMSVLFARLDFIPGNISAIGAMMIIAILALETVMGSAPHVCQTTTSRQIQIQVPSLALNVRLANTLLAPQLKKLIARVAMIQIVRLVLELAQVSALIVRLAMFWSTESVSFVLMTTVEIVLDLAKASARLALITTIQRVVFALLVLILIVRIVRVVTVKITVRGVKMAMMLPITMESVKLAKLKAVLTAVKLP